MSTVSGRERKDSVPALLQKRWAVIVGTAIVFGYAALAFSLLQKPVYEAVTTLYITAGTTGASSENDIVEASKQRVDTYGQLAYSGAVLTPALSAAGLDWPLEEARQKITVQSRPEVVTLTVSVRDSNPHAAQKLAAAIADSMTRAVATLEVPASGFEPAARLSIVTPATVASEPVAPTTNMNVVLAATIGLLVAALAVLLRDGRITQVGDASRADLTLRTADSTGDDPPSNGRAVGLDGEPARAVGP
jgi:succinoglycan biosynthesis transport protein ExoP